MVVSLNGTLYQLLMNIFTKNGITFLAGFSFVLLDISSKFPLDTKFKDFFKLTLHIVKYSFFTFMNVHKSLENCSFRFIELKIMH